MAKTRGSLPITKERREQVIRLLKTDVAQHLIAAELRVSAGVVAGIASRLRGKRVMRSVIPPSPPPPDTPDWVIRIIEAARAAPATTLFERCDALHAAMDAVRAATARGPGHSFGA